MDDLSALWRLHLIDQERDEKKKRSHEIERMLSDSSQVAAAHAARDAEQKHLVDLRGNLRDRELEAQTLDAKIKEIESRLYGGSVTHPKELESLEKDREMHLRQRGELDNKRLELMEAVEQTQQSASEKTSALKHAEQTRTTQVERLERERQALASRLVELDAEGERTRAGTDVEMLASYDRLRRTKGGRVMSRLKNNSCSECGMEAPSGMVARVHAGEELVFCSACGRILVG